MVWLSEEESKHCAMVKHRRVGDTLMLIDGRGTRVTAMLTDINRHRVGLQVLSKESQWGKRSRAFHLAIAPTKQRERMEWMLEKTVEIGIEKITFLICERSERQQIDLSRMSRIAIAAIKQSGTAFLPQITCLPFDDFLKTIPENTPLVEKYIAWCETPEDTPLLQHIPMTAVEMTVLVGPEGDFTYIEVEKAKNAGFKEISLGKKRLRTETAGLFACCLAAKE